MSNIALTTNNYDISMGLGNIVFNSNVGGGFLGTVNIYGNVNVGNSLFNQSNANSSNIMNIGGSVYISGIEQIGTVTNNSFIETGGTYDAGSGLSNSYINFNTQNYDYNIVTSTISSNNDYQTGESDITIQSQHIYMNTTGNVGINTTNPQFGFDVNTTARVNSLYVDTPDSGGAQLRIVNSSSTPAFIIRNDGTNFYLSTTGPITGNAYSQSYSSTSYMVFSGSNGYVGINCDSTPAFPLDVNGTISNKGTTGNTGYVTLTQGTSTTTGNVNLMNGNNSISASFYADATNVYINSVQSRNIVFQTLNTTRMTISTSGNVGIGVATPIYQLQLSTDSAAKPSTSTWTVSSDMRLKEDIELADISLCYSNIKHLKLKRWKWRDDIDPSFSVENLGDRHKLGWIAQDVSNVIPKSVERHDMYGISDCLSLNTDQIYATLYGCVEKIIQDKEQLEQTVVDLQNQIDNLTSEFNSLL